MEMVENKKIIPESTDFRQSEAGVQKSRSLAHCEKIKPEEGQAKGVGLSRSSSFMNREGKADEALEHYLHRISHRPQRPSWTACCPASKTASKPLLSTTSHKPSSSI
jgi:hypothetical protein